MSCRGIRSPDFTTPFDLKAAVRQYESRLIDATIQRTGRKRKAADFLGVDIATVVRKSKCDSPLHRAGSSAAPDGR
ncbi:MAG: hypothetical protein A3G81_18995 [Betaproteobacteria bacterium RIFCSPLOWO2_12_FULL_65_14]|nr:MAG: hypothetical protein A3G81_18995 [Betaproteobacteria bacterium RIFCSPLOWO2_12_FULL_65_14]